MSGGKRNICCWACRAACNSSFVKGKWWYSMACEHELFMMYDHDKFEADLDERAMDTAEANG